ncbi:hypothetical protein [Hydrotalea sp.]|uniref:hypothetical protein n=1 Tax=Hydrotalea sp. TaxID=2881279 RepID=UPI003D09D075
MKKILLFCTVLALIIIINACHQKQNNNKSTTTNDTTAFYPLHEILLEELKDVKNTPYFMYQVKTHIHTKKDSSVINPQQFEVLAQPFLSINLNSKDLKPYLNESVFHDLSTNSYSFTYTPKSNNDTLSIKSIVILLNDDNNNSLKDIFIHKMLHNSDTVIDEALHWKPANYFTIDKKYLLKDSVINKSKLLVNWQH